MASEPYLGDNLRLVVAIMSTDVAEKVLSVALGDVGSVDIGVIGSQE
jgi:hypothetical protein